MSRAEEKRMPSRATNVAYLLLAVATAACAGAPARGLHATPPGLGRLPYTDADVDFMAGMIPHHAQAVIMAGWAPMHGARKDVAVLCERIVVVLFKAYGAAQDEVVFRFASDVYADQNIEIDRMNQMLATVPSER